MENRKIPALIAIAAVVIAIVVFFAFGDDDTAEQDTEITQQGQTAAPSDDPDGGGSAGGNDEPSEPKEPVEPEVSQIEIRGGEPVGGVQEIEVTEGDELRVEIETDAADELHFHGFDVYLDIEPGKTNELVVENADIGGIHELESQTTGALLAEISVVPG